MALAIALIVWPAVAVRAQALDTEGIDGIVDIEEERGPLAGVADDGPVAIAVGLVVWAGFFAAIVMIIQKIRGRHRERRRADVPRSTEEGGHPHIGQPSGAARFCDACGTPLPEDGSFCEACGQRAR